MRRFNPCVCCLICLTLGLFIAFSCNRAEAHAAPAPHRDPTPAHAPDDVPADLTKDARLDRRYSLHEIGTPLGSLLQKVSYDDLNLSADRNCDTLKLQLHLVNRPLHQIMNALAELVPGAWYKTPSGKGYILLMRWTATSRRQRWWDLYLGEQHRILAAIPGMVLQAMRGKSKLPDKLSAADGNVEGFKQMLRIGATFFNLLPASLQEMIAGRINETSLVWGGWGTGMDEGATLVPFADLPTPVQRMLSGQPGPHAGPLDNSYVVFENFGKTVRCDVVDANGDIMRGGFGMDVPLDVDNPTFDFDQVRLYLRVRQLGQKSPPLWQEFADYRASRVWPNAMPPKDYRSKDPTLDRDRVGKLEEWADENHLEFVSDYYSIPDGFDIARLALLAHRSDQPPKEEPKPRATKQTPREAELNHLALDHDLSWKRMREDIYLLRNNRWYVRDRLEVPAPLLERWLDAYAREWAKEPQNQSSEPAEVKAAQLRRRLDWQAEVVSNLTPWQIFDGLRWAAAPPAKLEEYISPDQLQHRQSQYQVSFTPFMRYVNDLAFQYRLAQFYASLSADQRTALLAGDLDFYLLNVDQEQAALFIQPMLQICLDHRSRPILLGIRHPVPSVGDNLHLAITAPPMEQASQSFGLPALPGQEAP